QRRSWTPFVGGVAVAAVLVIAIALVATRTDAGRERILAVTLNALGGQLHPDSRLEVQRLEGGLFTGARLYGISLLDPGGEALAVVDSARIDYRVASFFRGDVVLDEVVAYGAEVVIYRLPGDSLWNYQELLQDTAAADTTGGPARATILRGLRLIDSNVTVRLPWEPAEDLSGAAREAEIAAA